MPSTILLSSVAVHSLPNSSRRVYAERVFEYSPVRSSYCSSIASNCFLILDFMSWLRTVRVAKYIMIFSKTDVWEKARIPVAAVCC